MITIANDIPRLSAFVLTAPSKVLPHALAYPPALSSLALVALPEAPAHAVLRHQE